MIDHADVVEAAGRIAGAVRPLTVADIGLRSASGAKISAALEFMQHTGTFKPRGALNFVRAHAECGTLPDAGVTIASGGNAGLACAWAARIQGTRATVFLPENAPAVKVDRLRSYGAEVRIEGREYADAAHACAEFAEATGALMSHAYDNPLIMAGAGTLALEMLAAHPEITVVALAVGGGGLFTGVQTVALHRGVRVLAVEPEGCNALNAALAAGRVVDAAVESVAADSLGARRVAEAAFAAAQHSSVHAITVGDDDIVAARRQLWDDRRLVVEHAAAAALAGVQSAGASVVGPEDHICVVLCGANTDPSSLR